MSDLPEAVVDRAVELTRRARRATDQNEAEAYRRERSALLSDHGFRARLKREDGSDVLVLHPEEWVVDGGVDVERVDDIGRGIEVALSGPDDDEEWETVEGHNRALARAVADEHGEPHAATADALADFAGNHYFKRIEDLTAAELGEFRTEYFPRNAFPDDDQRAALGESLRLVFETAGTEPPTAP